LLSPESTIRWLALGLRPWRDRGAMCGAAHPELLILAPCGFNHARATQEAGAVKTQIDSVGAKKVVVLDGSAYFNRPGPRLVDSLELLVDSR
jgi:hypothetical protein